MQAPFGRLQPDDFIRDVLFGNVDEHGPEAAIVVGFLQRRACGLHVGQRLLVAEQRVQNGLDVANG